MDKTLHGPQSYALWTKTKIVSFCGSTQGSENVRTSNTSHGQMRRFEALVENKTKPEERQGERWGLTLVQREGRSRSAVSSTALVVGEDFRSH